MTTLHIDSSLKDKWARLTDDDLQFIECRLDELNGLIQERNGESREVVAAAIKEYRTALEDR
jgi:uncharacterized protein YjbJ (UPF0337 family)